MPWISSFSNLPQIFLLSKFYQRSQNSFTPTKQKSPAAQESVAGENAVSHRFRDGLHQGRNVYIKIDSHISEKRVRQILHGVLKGKSNSGLVYCYITDEKTMHYWKMDDLK